MTVDDVAGACDATRHLLELGHRRIAVITGNMATTSSRERMQGYGQAMREAGLVQDDRLVVHGDYSSGSGDASTSNLWRADSGRAPFSVSATTWRLVAFTHFANRA